jgi:SAM-dependent methyltransferase
MARQGCLAQGQVRSVLDVGSATGLSTLALRRLFPAAAITGVDLSPHFLAVAEHEQQRRWAGGRAGGGGGGWVGLGGLAGGWIKSGMCCLHCFQAALPRSGC